MWNTLSFAAVAIATTLLPSAFATFDATANTNMAVYWGQGPNQERLSFFCDDNNIDIIIIGFVNVFPDQSGGYPGTNFGNQCGSQTYKNPDGSSSLLYSNCPDIGPDITYCQSLGKKVLLSLGGAIPSNQHLNSGTTAQQFAGFLWNAFGPPTSNPTFPRPFGNAVVDGFDFDIESVLVAGENAGDLNRGYRTMVQSLRILYATYTAKTFYISGAPQCIAPDAHLSDAIENSWFDFLFVQFYNTPACSARAYFDHTYGGANTNISLDTWVHYVQHLSYNRRVKVFLGLPAAPDPNVVYDTEMYLQPAEAQEIIQAFQCADAYTLGGVMVYEATYSENNQINGQPYADVLKGYLEDGTCATPAPQISSVPYSTTSALPTLASPSMNATTATNAVSTTQLASARISPTQISTQSALSNYSTSLSNVASSPSIAPKNISTTMPATSSSFISNTSAFTPSTQPVINSTTATTRPSSPTIITFSSPALNSSVTAFSTQPSSTLNTTTPLLLSPTSITSVSPVFNASAVSTSTRSLNTSNIVAQPRPSSTNSAKSSASLNASAITSSTRLLSTSSTATLLGLSPTLTANSSVVPGSSIIASSKYQVKPSGVSGSSGTAYSTGISASASLFRSPNASVISIRLSSSNTASALTSKLPGTAASILTPSISKAANKTILSGSSAGIKSSVAVTFSNPPSLQSSPNAPTSSDTLSISRMIGASTGSSVTSIIASSPRVVQSSPSSPAIVPSSSNTAFRSNLPSQTVVAPSSNLKPQSSSISVIKSSLPNAVPTSVGEVVVSVTEVFTLTSCGPEVKNCPVRTLIVPSIMTSAKISTQTGVNTPPSQNPSNGRSPSAATVRGGSSIGVGASVNIAHSSGPQSSSIPGQGLSPVNAPSPSTVRKIVTTEIIYTTLTTCPVTQTITSGTSLITQVTQSVSAILVTSTSTISTAYIAPASTGSPSNPLVSAIVPGVTTTEIVYTTVTTCPVTNTITSGTSRLVQVTQSVSTILNTTTLTIPANNAAPTAQPLGANPPQPNGPSNLAATVPSNPAANGSKASPVVGTGNTPTNAISNPSNQKAPIPNNPYPASSSLPPPPLAQTLAQASNTPQNVAQSGSQNANFQNNPNVAQSGSQNANPQNNPNVSQGASSAAPASSPGSSNPAAAAAAGAQQQQPSSPAKPFSPSNPSASPAPPSPSAINTKAPIPTPNPSPSPSTLIPILTLEVVPVPLKPSQTPQAGALGQSGQVGTNLPFPPSAGFPGKNSTTIAAPSGVASTSAGAGVSASPTFGNGNGNSGKSSSPAVFKGAARRTAGVGGGCLSAIAALTLGVIVLVGAF